ncbi:MAG TPA: GatB/YqeY domain-containing protein [Longimicrobiales bacterium]|nr:GatB/YqeY domain-containing protein [Longimicrobiales bacterium]
MSSELKARIQQDLNAARKARDRLKTTVLSTLLSDVRNREIEIGHEADDDEVRAVVAKAIKQRHEASEQMAKGGRDDLASKEEREAEILSEYLPPPLSEEEVRSMVREIVEEGVGEIGPAMGRLMPRIRGRFDGKEANRIVREELGR